MAGDGSVEIRITGSVDPSVAASATEAKAAIAGLGDSTAVSAKAMAAALAAAGGNLKKITPDMLGLGAATQAVAAGEDAATAATVANTVATEASTKTINSSRAAYESLALVHEALSGRFTRMAGTSTILAQALAGQAATTRTVAFLTSGLGLSIIGTVAAFGLLTAATISYGSEEKKLTDTTLGLGAQSGLTAEQLRKIGESADSSSQSIRETTKAAEAFAASGLHDENTVRQLSNSVEAYSELIGVKFAEAQKKLAGAMEDPIKGAKELHDQLGILDGDQLEQIRTLTELGEKDQAAAIITQALTQRIDEAKDAGVALRGEFGQLIDTLSNVYNWIGQVSEGFGREAETLVERLIPALHAAGQAHREVAAAASEQARNEAQLNAISAKGAAAFDDTPEGRAIKERSELIGKLKDSIDAMEVDTARHGAHSDAVQRDRVAVEDYRHAVQTYLTPIQKKIEADQLDVKIAEAKHAHNKQLVADLTEQKALLEQSGQIESANDARAMAAGAGDVAGARIHAPKARGGHGPSIVSEWEEQLHESEIATNNYFADQTQSELAFWQGKVELTKTGSKEWLAVQTKIYDLSRTLAKREYDEHIADLNDKLEADRGDWKKEQAHWQEKLAYIRSTFTEESTEYKDAHRQMEAEERQHQDQMIAAELSGNSKAISALKTSLQAMRQLRQEDANVAIAVIKEKANSSILGEVSAARQIGEVHRQLAAQEIADAERTYAAEEALRQKGLADALATYGVDSAKYKAGLEDEKNAFKAFQDQIALLRAKATAQQIADINAVKNAYASYISGVVSSTTSAFTGMLAGSQTWQQGLKSVYTSILSTVDQVLSRMLTNWIVTHILMTSAQRAQLAVQGANHAASEGAKTAATATGATARTTVEATAATTAAATGAAIRVAEVTGEAAVAFANAFAATAAIPIVGPSLAPAAGAAAMGAVLAMVPQASLATGTNYLPADMVVQAHEGERVIPKADNTKLIQLLEVAAQAPSGAGSSGMPSASAGGGGDAHLHLYGNIIHNPSQLRQWFEQNHQAVGAAVRRHVRSGGNIDLTRR